MEQYIVRKLREDMERVLRELSELKKLILDQNKNRVTTSDLSEIAQELKDENRNQ